MHGARDAENGALPRKPDPRREEGAGGEGGAPLLADTHAHLDLDDYRADRGAVIARAEEAGVSLIVNVGIDRASSERSVALAESHPRIFAAVGQHPHDASSLTDEELSFYERLAGHPKVVAIGETGLDFYRNLSPRDAQEAAFRSQIRLARKTGLPLVIHSRDALADTLRVMDEERADEVGGVMHCFPGDAAYAREVAARGFHVGVGGPVTYSPRGRLVGAVTAAPLESLLLETDAPWLPPAPHRGKRNEPAWVRLVAERAAEIREMSVGDLSRLTTANALRLFRIPGPSSPSVAYAMWGNLYLNITNRCTNACDFCVRYRTDSLWGYNLKLDREPGVEDIIAAVGDPLRFREIVFCGYGEPTLRLDVVRDVGRRLREAGARVRLDTNGQANLIWNRNVVPELLGAVDRVSVSLNAGDAEAYHRLCRSRFGPGAFEHVVAFVRECRKAGLETAVTVVDVPGADVGKARSVADSLGVPLRVRSAGMSRGAGGRA